MNDQAPFHSIPNNEMSLLDLLAVPLKRKRMILMVTAGAIIFSLIYSLFIPRLYTATARVLPPQDSGTGTGLLDMMNSSISPILKNLQEGVSSADLYIGILKSRSVADEIIKKFNLEKLYDENSRSKIYKILEDRTHVDIAGKTQIVSVSVEDGSPQRAAEMANAYVEALDQLNQKVNMTEGQRKRTFLEKRLEVAEKDLRKAETDLKDFQQKYKLIAVDDQARASIEGAAKIKAEIISTETELEVMKIFRTEKQAEAKMLMAKISELKKQLEKIESGVRAAGGNQAADGIPVSTDSFFSIQEIPLLSMKLGQFLREVKVQEGVFELLTSQYELAKIEEARDMNTIRILDSAIAPDKKSSPRRMLIMFLSAVTIFTLTVFLSYFIEYVGFMEHSDPEDYRRFLNALRSWRTS